MVVVLWLPRKNPRSENGHDICGARNSTGQVQRLAGHKERPPAQLLAPLGERLQVELLTNGHAPAGEKDFVQFQPLTLSYGRPRLIRVRVSGDCGKSSLPMPTGTLNASSHSHEFASITFSEAQLILLSLIVRLILKLIPAANEQDVTLLELDSM